MTDFRTRFSHGGFKAAVAAVVAGLLLGANVKGEEMSYGEACQFLTQHTKADRTSRRRRPRGDLPRVAGPRDDVDLRRARRDRASASQPRVHRGRQAQPPLQQLRRRGPHVAFARGRTVQPLVRARGRSRTWTTGSPPPAMNEGRVRGRSASRPTPTAAWRGGCSLTNASATDVRPGRHPRGPPAGRRRPRQAVRHGGGRTARRAGRQDGRATKRSTRSPTAASR